MKIKVTSLPVLDQRAALAFYTEKLDFVKKRDIPIGEYSWLTIAAKEDEDGVQILLEPLGMEASKDYQKHLYDKGIPWMQLYVDKIEDVYEHLKGKGIEFSMEPTEMGGAKFAIFDDTCGNRIQLVEEL